MREVIHKHTRLPQTILQHLLLAVNPSKVLCDRVFVRVGRRAGAILDGPFGGAEALYAGCNAGMDEVLLRGVAGVEVHD